MARIDDLADQYDRHISAPWQRNLAGAQKVIFVVYPKEDERRLRSKIKEFEHRTKAAGHEWHELDLTNIFAEWMAAEKYRDEYFHHPEDLVPKLDKDFRRYCIDRLRVALSRPEVNDNSVLAVYGVAGLYGFTFLHEVLKAVESTIRGRVAVFFPGSHEMNTYRLLDAREGWNYMATPIAEVTNQ